MDSKSMTGSGVIYRLPAYLGGAELEVHPDFPGDSNVVRLLVPTDEVGEEPGPDYIIAVPRGLLTEVRPPSIDDPGPLPVEVFDLDDDRVVINEATTFRTRTAAAYVHITSSEGKSRGDGVYLTTKDLRRIARACWQRANAVEAGERA